MNRITIINKIRTRLLVLPVIALFAFLTFNSCDDYLDINKYVYDQTTMDSIFLSKARTEQYINGTAALLFDESLLMGTDWGGAVTLPSGSGADEAIIPFMLNGNSILYDEITETNTRINPWPTCYKGIRKANIVLANIHKNQEITEMESRDFKGRAYFLRAYFYFYLVRLYGPVPILPDVAFDTDVDIAKASIERSPYDQCVEKICADFEAAAGLLPLQRIESEQLMPTRGAALAFKARMQLYAASPLFNGNTYYADWKNSEGVPFIPQTEDKTKWAKAAATFKRIIDMNTYELQTVAKMVNDKGTGTLPLPATVSSASFPNGAGNIDPYKSYKSIFDGTYQPYSVKEYIYYARRSDSDDRLYFPDAIGGNATFSVTQDMIDAYSMADGRSFDEATEDEKSYKAVGSNSTFALEYQLSANRARRDDNREPRYFATIGFNHCIWPGTSFRGTENLKNREVTYYDDGNAKNPSDNNHRNRTGYTCRKYIHQEDIGHWNSTKKSKVWPLARYAEVLLGYAEALNEMQEGSYTDESGVVVTKDVNEIVKYFNQVRYRAGQPGITIADASDYNKMKKIVKHEWQIEFAFESRRYWDLRRWKDAYDAYNKPIKGLDVSAKSSQREQFYTARIWNTEVYMKRMFSNKMYFWPIDRNVLQKNGKLVQNPGWK
ncbi:RagB/SusD family nutrient uptake outer membrane protein [Bacteroides ihuae]|uniref:RagB/SusD family nutrient uptake outer membrane protein n=1 Tax=Bacteroides ihuae TaxID=1852362 RepID=UPI0008D957BA|nr:RagB/SusD family nutrient uptake outer membrane protein [Bacteroides ihuae]